MLSESRNHALDDLRTKRNLLISREVLEGIISALEGLHYGSLEIVVHNSEVVQIERKEKLRFKQKDRIKKPA